MDIIINKTQILAILILRCTDPQTLCLGELVHETSDVGSEWRDQVSSIDQPHQCHKQHSLVPYSISGE